MLLTSFIKSIHDQVENTVNEIASFFQFSHLFSIKGARDAPKQTPMTHEDFELCRKVALEEEKLGKFDHAGNNIDVPPLSIENHMEMMHGASAGTCLYIICKLLQVDIFVIELN